MGPPMAMIPPKHFSAAETDRWLVSPWRCRDVFMSCSRCRPGALTWQRENPPWLWLVSQGFPMCKEIGFSSIVIPCEATQQSWLLRHFGDPRPLFFNENGHRQWLTMPNNTKDTNHVWRCMEIAPMILTINITESYHPPARAGILQDITLGRPGWWRLGLTQAQAIGFLLPNDGFQV